MAWIRHRRERLARKRANALSEIQDDKALFEESIIAAKAAGSAFSEDLVSSVSARFEHLQKDAEAATTKSQIDTLVAQSAVVVQLRAYLAPPAELENLGQTTLSTMAEWGVPAADLDVLRKDVLPKLACTDVSNPVAVNGARGALHTVFCECNSWSEWLDDYNAEMQKVGYWLTGFIGLSLGSAILLLAHGFVVWGLLCAGRVAPL
jgi:hypothetical protein